MNQQLASCTEDTIHAQKEVADTGFRMWQSHTLALLILTSTTKHTLAADPSPPRGVAPECTLPAPLSSP